MSAAFVSPRRLKYLGNVEAATVDLPSAMEMWRDIPELVTEGED